MKPPPAARAVESAHPAPLARLWTPFVFVRMFFADYFSRHTDNWNRALHVIGVPLAPFLFLFLLVTGRFVLAAAAFVVGYLLQWIGHRIEGNEVGEVILLKLIVRRVAAALRS
jgi:hypothetical protein